jgi:hypothetical protein
MKNHHHDRSVFITMTVLFTVSSIVIVKRPRRGMARGLRAGCWLASGTQAPGSTNVNRTWGAW